MSEKPRKPQRTPLKRKTGEYSLPPDSSERRQRAPTQSSPPAPPPQQNVPLPAQPQPEQVVVVQQVNSGNTGSPVISAITWPFRKLAGVITWLVKTIIEAMIRSVVSFIVWTLIFIVIGAIVGMYGFALVESNLNYVEAFMLMLERIVSLGERIVSLTESALELQDSFPTPIPPTNP